MNISRAINPAKYDTLSFKQTKLKKCETPLHSLLCQIEVVAIEGEGIEVEAHHL